MKTVSFICCRAGSKGLPGKNAKSFLGVPLIQRTIMQSNTCSFIHKTYVSTDCPSLSSMAKEAGASVPFLRPMELARDDSSELDSWKHMASFLLDNGELEEDDFAVILPVTSPLRLVSDIDQAIRHAQSGNFDLVIGVSAAQKNPFFNMVVQNEEGLFSVVSKPDAPISRRQDCVPVFDITTFFYVQKVSRILKIEHVLEGKVGGVIVPRRRSIDIDDLFDFEIAELIAERDGLNDDS